MKNKAEKQNNHLHKVELGMELGDINADKLFEMPFMSQKKKQSSKKKSCE
ncbi:hypothetical protein [Bacillus sp. 03113]|nr:hypothetical protein [Bacillus sp. 03113]